MEHVPHVVRALEVVVPVLVDIYAIRLHKPSRWDKKVSYLDVLCGWPVASTLGDSSGTTEYVDEILLWAGV